VRSMYAHGCKWTTCISTCTHHSFSIGIRCFSLHYASKHHSQCKIDTAKRKTRHSPIREFRCTSMAKIVTQVKFFWSLSQQYAYKGAYTWTKHISSDAHTISSLLRSNGFHFTMLVNIHHSQCSTKTSIMKWCLWAPTSWTLRPRVRHFSDIMVL